MVVLDFHATVLEVVLIAGVGAYIGFLIGLRSGIYLASTGGAHQPQAKAKAKHSSKAKSGDHLTPNAS